MDVGFPMYSSNRSLQYTTYAGLALCESGADSQRCSDQLPGYCAKGSSLRASFASPCQSGVSRVFLAWVERALDFAQDRRTLEWAGHK